MTVCPTCQSLDPKAPLSKERVVRLRNPYGSRLQETSTDHRLIDEYGLGRVALVDRSFEEITESSKAGCNFCDLLVRICLELGIDGDEINLFLENGINPRVTVWHREKKRSSFELFVSEGAKSCLESFRALLTSAYIGREDFDGLFRPLRPVSSHPRSPQALDFLKMHLSNCVKEHPDCHMDEYMPPRLIDVDFGPDRCRLVETENLEKQPYTALSYCWGSYSGQRFMTTNGNIQSRQSSIELKSFPLCLRDGILLTKMLGIKYLWIDALCIIQDSLQDWQRQVGLMSYVYQNAYLVIAAGSSSESCISFLETGPRPVPINVTFNHLGKSGTISCMCLDGSGIHESYERMYGGCDPLDGRAWTLQERILSTRLINFSKTELQWTCKTKKSCEAAHTDSSYHNVVLQTVQESSSAYNFWHKEVMEISCRNLTYVSNLIFFLR